LKTTRLANFKNYFGDFSDDSNLDNLWADTMSGAAEQEKLYVVQTTTKVIERCLLMTTDPGDLVLDPTCGSGTTAYVAEQWGRRWITCDTSRVALALAKHRLMTAKFDYYQLRRVERETWLEPERDVLSALTDPRGLHSKVRDNVGSGCDPKTFACKTVPHITLKSIARNTSLDPVFAKHEPMLAEKLRCVEPRSRQGEARALKEPAGRQADRASIARMARTR
jgi:adenine-specific DNA-methyltransferase